MDGRDSEEVGNDGCTPDVVGPDPTEAQYLPCRSRRSFSAGGPPLASDTSKEFPSRRVGLPSRVRFRGPSVLDLRNSE